MSRLLPLLFISLLTLPALAADVALDWSGAAVTTDAGTAGNVTGGNLPDPGDELGWTLPADLAPGVYRVLIDGRTGDNGEGTGFVAGYRLRVPDGCLAPGATPHEIGFAWPGDKPPTVEAKGEGYSVFRGEMPAAELLCLHPGDLLRVRGGSGWSMLWQLILRPVPPEQQVELTLSAGPLAGLYTGDRAELQGTLTNWRDADGAWTLETTVTNLAGETLSTERRPLTFPARAATPVSIPITRPAYGPLWVRLRVLEGEQQLAEAARGFAFSLAPDPRQVSADSPFGIHKSDLSEWPAIGAKWDRLWDTGDTWNVYEKERGKFNWEGLDRKVSDAEARGVKLLYVLAYTPTWASARPQEPHYTGDGAAAEPADINDWRTFVRTVVSRYKGRIDAFEVWNEPNAGFFSGSVDAYVALLQAAYEEAKAANPDCTVMGISGTGGYLEWMEEVLKRGGLKYMDAVSVHTYTTPQAPETANVLGRFEATRRLIEKYGGTQPIWDTEVGIWQPERANGRPLSEEEIAARAPEATRPNWEAGWPYRPISELEAARHCVRMYALAIASDIRHLFWYSWIPGGLPMFTVDNEPRLMTVAYAAMTAKLDGAQFVRRLTLGTADTHLCLFRRDEQALALAWCTRPEGRQVSFHTDTRARVGDMWGNERALDGAALTLGPDPQYIEGLSLAELEAAGLSGTVLVFESPTAAITADVAEANVREHTSPPFHGDRRVMGLPDAGDKITWTLEAIEPGVYALELDGYTGARPNGDNYIPAYVVTVARADGSAPVRLSLHADPQRPPAEAGEDRFYGPMLAEQPIALGPGDKVSVRSIAGWAFVGPLTLRKVGEASQAPVACPRLAAPLTLDGDLGDWPDLPALRIDQRRQAVMGVADPFASTGEHDSWRGPADLSGRARLAWDGEALWLAVAVTDDALHPAPGANAWSGDCVEVFADLRAPDAVGTPAMGEGVYQILCPSPDAAGTTYPAAGKLPAGSDFRTSKTATGWVLEGRIPLAAAAPGRPFGLDFALDDADNPAGEAAVRKSQLVWHGTANDFEDPSAYGVFELAK